MTERGEPTAPKTGDSHVLTWMLAVLLLLAIAPYFNSLQNGFVFDDHNEVETNPYIRSFSHVGDIFSTRILAHLGARGATNYYRPIGIFGFLICYKLFGLLPYGFHLANLVVHALIVCLLFGLSRRLFRDDWLAFIAAAIFALHPIHTESVAWVAGITDLDLAVFYIPAFWFYLESARPGGGRSEKMQLGMVACFVLALLSKEQAVTLAVLAAIFEHFYREDRAETSWRQKFARYGALWLIVPAYVLFRVWFFGAFAPVQLTRNVSWSQAILSAGPLTSTYIFKTFWPAKLIAFYPFHKTLTPLDPAFLGSVVLLAVIAVAFVLHWKRHHLVSFGFVWFFLNIAPVLNSRWLGPNVFTERYLYLPSVGFCWVVAWRIERGWKASTTRSRTAQFAFATALGILAILGFARIVTRNRDWRSDEAYYRVTLADVPEAGGLRLNLGAVYWNMMRPADAEREWKLALAYAPDNALLLNDLGLASAGRKRNQEAMEYFERSMHLRPNYTDAHLNLGRLFVESGQLADAEAQLQTAVALAPLSIETRNELGKLYFNSGRYREAAAQFEASAASIPNATAYDYLGDLALRVNQTTAAEQNYRKAIAVEAFDSRAHFGLGRIYQAMGRRSDAVTEYRAGLTSDPLNVEAKAAVNELTANVNHDLTK